MDITARQDVSCSDCLINDGRAFGNHWMEHCVKLRSRLDDLLKGIIACLPHIKCQFSGEQSNDYIGHIHVESNSQNVELRKQTCFINQCVPHKSNLDNFR